MIIMILAIQITLILIFTTIAVITDLKTGYIPNLLTGFMIVTGLVINALFNINVLYISILISILLYLFGMYISKKGFGGGDIKLYIGINCILPIFNNSIFILYVILLSNILGFVYMKFKKIKVVKFAPFIFIALILLILFL